MATESSGGPPLGNSNKTPPTTTNPSRQPSVNKVQPTSTTATTASTDMAAAVPIIQPTTGTVRDVRANSLAEPPPPSSTSRSAQQQQPPPSTTTPTATNETISYSAERIIGNGSFGVVFQASVVESGEIVAIKKVLQDKRFKNRELQIMRQLVKDGHSNIVALKHCFYSQVSVYFFWGG